ncbi:hypothetical protein IE077_000405 [Cardiosporidium cionae]|uniref:Uncharacterized protein n=1 Tax=Cardiosporidium cionae TaxID=476202 RepID=A0ABQ7J4A8_9APIC|nr:hypothetical protein IE077_000405 [Cardiosporidium cionae]|eukprot:KAF8817924.1 hypothetical protein IE077_000405 [Cardiosporidium cionae]
MVPKVQLDLRGYAGQPSYAMAVDRSDFSRKRACSSLFDAGRAGQCSQKISEMLLTSRKQIIPGKVSSLEMKKALGIVPSFVFPNTNTKRKVTKKSMVRYASADDQQYHFKTCWQPNEDAAGIMEFQFKRKPGSASIEIDYGLLDSDATYLRWKRPLQRQERQCTSHLQNDRFLTVAENAERSDKPREVKNREIPFPNDDGPFEMQQAELPVHRRENLDRTLTPRLDSCRLDGKSFKRMGHSFH